MKTQYREVIYLIGDSEEKRKALRSEQPGVARAHNDEVVDICRMEGRDYYVIGTHPFGGFTVGQYVRYERSLLGSSPAENKEIKRTLSRLGARISLNKRIKSLDFLDRRLAALAGRITPETRTLAIDLDGVPYSRHLKSKLHRITRRLSRWFEVWVSVTDSRFAGNRAAIAEMRKGSLIALSRNTFRSRPLSRRILLARLRRCFTQPAEPLEKGKIIEVRRDISMLR